MSSYTLNNTSLDKNKVFILQKSEIEKRFDPEYYGHSFNNYEKIIIKKPYKRFSQILKTINNGFDFRDYKESGTPYIKVANIRKGAFRFDKMQYIDFDSSEISKNIQLKKGNILLTRKGTFGYAISLDKDYDYVISSEVFYIEINQDLISSKYLEIFFNSKIGQAQFDKNKIGAIMGSLSQDAIKELKIPIPSTEIQNKIIEVYSNYTIQKQQNEAEAEKLLASIDIYLLKELGITLPAKEENTLKSRMFTTSIKEVASSRFDPFFHTIYFKQIEENLGKSKYELIKLHRLCNLQNGCAFKSSDYSMEETTTLNIRMSNIRPNNNFDPDYNIKYLPENYSEIYKEYILKDGDILIAMTDMAADPKILGVPTIVSNTNGRSFLLNQRVGKLFDFDLSKIEINYLKEMLGSKIIKAYYNKMGARGVQINISSEQILSALIPVPPLAKQIEIANHITKIREQAQALKDKTKIALEQANQEIENLLLN